MSSKSKSALQKEEYDLAPPDGGWGYLICAAAVVIFVMGSGFLNSFGLIYKEVIDRIGLGSTEISLMSGINAVFFAFAGFLTSSFLNYFAKRQLAFIAVTIHVCGNIIAVFVNSAIPFYLAFVLQGIGFGLLLNLTFSLVNEYFLEKRLFANSIIQTVQATIMMMIPQFVNFLYELYGYRGTTLIITGVSLQAFVAVALWQPVEWHMRKIPKLVATEDVQVLLLDDENVPALKLNELEPFEQSVEIPPADEKKPSLIVKILKEVFDVSVIKAMLKTNMSWGMALSAFTDATFSVLMPQALYSISWDQKSVAWAITLYSFGDLAGRILFTLFSKWITMGNQIIYLIGTLLTVVSRMGLLCSSSKMVTLVFMTMMGFARCSMVLFMPVIVGEMVSKEKFPAAMGLIMVLVGISSICLGSIAGAIRDYTDSYTVMFWALNSLSALSMVSWTIELIYKRRSQKKKPAS